MYGDDDADPTAGGRAAIAHAKERLRAASAAKRSVADVAELAPEKNCANGQREGKCKGKGRALRHMPGADGGPKKDKSASGSAVRPQKATTLGLQVVTYADIPTRSLTHAFVTCRCVCICRRRDVHAPVRTPPRHNQPIRHHACVRANRAHTHTRMLSCSRRHRRANQHCSNAGPLQRHLARRHARSRFPRPRCRLSNTREVMYTPICVYRYTCAFIYACMDGCTETNVTNHPPVCSIHFVFARVHARARGSRRVCMCEIGLWPSASVSTSVHAYS